MNRSFKLQVMVSDVFVSRLDALCKVMGCSRSAVCSMILNTSIDKYEELYGSSSISDSAVEHSQIKLE